MKTTLILKIVSACSALVMLLAVPGCKEAVSTIGLGKNKLLSQSEGGITLGDLLSQYDTSNLVGVIRPQKELYSIYSLSSANPLTTFDGTQSWGDATFIDSYGNPYDVALVVFDSQFVHQATGYYAYTGTALGVFTDGSTGNLVLVIPNDSSYGSGDTLLPVSHGPLITNFVRGQNVSRDSSITINWTGSSSDFAAVSITVDDPVGPDTIGQGISIGGYFHNTGSKTLSFVPSQLKLGYADVVVKKFEPKFFTLSSGKRVCVLCETSDDVTVKIVN